MSQRLLDQTQMTNVLLNVIDDLQKLKQKTTFVTLPTASVIAADVTSACSSSSKSNAINFVRSVVLDHCSRAEKFSPLSFWTTMSLIRQLTTNNLSVTDETFNCVVKMSSQSSIHDLAKILSNHPEKKLLLEALKLAGSQSPIFVDRFPGETTVIEKIDGYTFALDVLTQKHPANWKAPSCILIDGLVESVSEIHRLLEDFSNSKQTLFIFARGFADDVISTVKLNNVRKSFDVHLVAVKFDFDGINVLNDLATVIGTDVVSSSKGQLISTLSAIDTVFCPQIMIRDRKLVFVNSDAINRTKRQIAFLQQKRNEQSLDDISSIYDARIKTLTPSCVRVLLPHSRDSVMRREQIDVGFRLARSMIKRGSFSKELTDCKLINQLDSFMPFESAIASLKFAQSCVNFFRRAGMFILES